MCNLIDTCSIILLISLNTCAVCSSNEGIFNVGTVLFNSSDLNKKRWSRTSIELLQARRHFQNIIPSPSLTTFNEHYVNNILNYFTNAFSILKREAMSPELTEVMEKALSDAIGGYLKVWVLPVTKLTYYGGSISQDNAVKVFKLYEKLKRNLNTNGSGWRKPSKTILNKIAIKVIPYGHVPHTHTRSMKYPCEHLAYFEKSDTGLTIPTPYINWNEPPYSMFIPVRNESLVQLNSPSSSDALLKYYDIAQSCCQSKSPEACNEFDLRFQDWLSNNVVPHINDDKLYIAFGSLLSLINKTNEFIQKSSNLCDCDYDKFTLNSLLSRLPPCMTSNKFIFLIIILIIEIIWCVPALIYIICSKRKSRMKQRTKFFLDTFKRRRYHTVGRIDNSEERNTINKKDTKNLDQICQSRMIGNEVKLCQNSRDKNVEADTQYPSHTFKRSTGQVTSVFSDINHENACQCESVTLINEKLTLDTTHLSQVQSVLLPISRDINTPSQTESITKGLRLETTITKIIRDKSGSTSKSCVKSSNSNMTVKEILSEVKQNSQELEDKDEVDDMCPCRHCIEHNRNDMEALRITESKETRALNITNNLRQTERRNVPNTRNRTKLPKLQPKVYGSRNIKLNQSKGLKLNSGEPLLEIRIDRPAAEITVDITKTSRKNVKPSRIPRLAGVATAKDNTPRNLKPCLCVQQTSKILKKRSMDDLEAKRKVVKRKKLNVTF